MVSNHVLVLLEILFITDEIFYFRNDLTPQLLLVENIHNLMYCLFLIHYFIHLIMISPLWLKLNPNQIGLNGRLLQRQNMHPYVSTKCLGYFLQIYRTHLLVISLFLPVMLMHEPIPFIIIYDWYHKIYLKDQGLILIRLILMLQIQSPSDFFLFLKTKVTSHILN